MWERTTTACARIVNNPKVNSAQLNHLDVGMSSELSVALLFPSTNTTSLDPEREKAGEGGRFGGRGGPREAPLFKATIATASDVLSFGRARSSERAVVRSARVVCMLLAFQPRFRGRTADHQNK